MFCPRCGTDYREGFTECADCRIPLVPDDLYLRLEAERRKRAEENRKIRFVEVCRVQGEPAADIVRAFLETHGIESTTTGQAAQSVHRLNVDGMGEVKILVREEDRERARGLIAEQKRHNPFSPEP